MMILRVDVYHTRRQRLHHLLDHTGTLCWSGQYVTEALEYLEARSEYEFELQGRDREKPWKLIINKP